MVILEIKKICWGRLKMINDWVYTRVFKKSYCFMFVGLPQKIKKPERKCYYMKK